MTTLPDTERTIAVRPYREGDAAAFQRINEAWISEFFVLEPKDREVLGRPQTTILDKGGAIVFATVDDEPMGCCALVPIAREGDRITEYEVAKMGVLHAARGLGLGRLVLEATIAEARTRGAKRLYLETNHALAPALHLYRAVGFQPVPAERLAPSPYERADVFMEMWLSDNADG